MSRLTGPHQTLSNKGLNPTLSAIQSCPRPFRYLSLSPVIWGRKVTVSRHHYGKRHEQSLGTSAREHPQARIRVKGKPSRCRSLDTTSYYTPENRPVRLLYN